ncbi:MAG: 50S ribosomal protein L4 [Patescibacteria group bacterium]|nr:50S ribosomal protein L4 [Patescibacteria group bacterium]
MAIKVKIYNQQAEEKGEMELSAKIFGVPANAALVHQAVVAQMANMRKVLAHTLIRSEVRGGGKKPWAQKGTGRARHGSSRSPIWRGGGVTFGPRKDRNFKLRINKKMKQAAIFMALSDKVASNHFIVLDQLAMAEYKTKAFNAIVAGLEKQTGAKPLAAEPAEAGKQKSQEVKKQENKKTKKQENKKRSILIMVDKADEKLNNSVRNLPGIKLQNLDNINVVDLLKYKNLIMTKAAIKKTEERYG